MKLNMPGPLKHILVDDWEAITKNNQVSLIHAFVYTLSLGLRLYLYLASLALWKSSTNGKRRYSRNPRIILRSFHLFNYSASLALNALDRLKDPALLLPTVVAGIQVYFDRALGANLLYRSERLQYSDIRKEFVTGPTVKVGQERDMSTIYGAEHLVRLLGTPLFLSHTIRGSDNPSNSEHASGHRAFQHGYRIYVSRSRLRQRLIDVRSPSFYVYSKQLMQHLQLAL
jgi:mortality factor 4-like protein 1